MNTFSVGECVSFGWEMFQKRAGFFVAAMIVFMIATGVSSAIPVAAIIFGLLLKMGSIAFSLKAYEDPMKVALIDLWAPSPFWKFTLASLAMAALIIIGAIFLIVPGIIIAIRYLFVQYLVMDRQLGVSEAMKESARITQGHRWDLFVLVLAIIGINVVGALCFGIGLLVSIPVSLFAVARAYRLLEHAANEMVAAPTA